jgi:His-Xaa-Ser system protein HxsD
VAPTEEPGTVMNFYVKDAAAGPTGGLRCEPTRDIVVVFDASSHAADAIQRAAYKYCAHFSMELQRDGENLRCLLQFLSDDADPGLVADFRTEVLDQVLRQRIRNETEGVRNLILALAFSNVTNET